jgi:hypothetical protein
MVFFSTVFTENDNHMVPRTPTFISVFIAFHFVVSIAIHHPVISLSLVPPYLNILLIHDPQFNFVSKAPY